MGCKEAALSRKDRPVVAWEKKAVVVVMVKKEKTVVEE